MFASAVVEETPHKCSQDYLGNSLQRLHSLVIFTQVGVHVYLFIALVWSCGWPTLPLPASLPNLLGNCLGRN